MLTKRKAQQTKHRTNNTSDTTSKVIIWDLGGVLVKPNYFGIMNHIGLKSLLWYSVRDFKSPHIRPLIFKLLHMLEQAPAGTPCLYDEKGKPLPYCLYKWLTGKQTNEEIIEQFILQIDRLNKENYFSSARQKSLIQKIVQTLFNAEALAHYSKPITRGIKLVKSCAQALGSKHKLMILSNWDQHSFEKLYNSPQGKIIFEHFKFEDIVISGTIGLAKPDPRCFHYLIDTYKLIPQECIFIDDQLENIQAAQSCGMTAIHLKNKNYRDLKKFLSTNNILS
jgi:FMN phosphatase YigB (HAD superfamily)